MISGEDFEDDGDEDLLDNRHLLILDNRRHVVLLVVFLATVISEMAWLVNLWERRFEEDAREIGGFFYNFFRYFNRLAFVLLYLPATYVIENFGIKKSVTLGMILTSIGLWVCVWELYTLATVFLACGMPFIMNVCTSVSSKWYGPRGRNAATLILLLDIVIP